MIPYCKGHSTPFTEDYRIERNRDRDGHWHLAYTEDFLQSLLPY